MNTLLAGMCIMLFHTPDDERLLVNSQNLIRVAEAPIVFSNTTVVQVCTERDCYTVDETLESVHAKLELCKKEGS